MDELIGTRSHESATLMLIEPKAIPERMRKGVRELTALLVPEEDRRKGYATHLLQAVCNEADRERKTLMVFVQPFADWHLSKTQLRDWYARFQFLIIQQEPLLMARMPGSSPRTLTPIQQAFEDQWANRVRNPYH